MIKDHTIDQCLVELARTMAALKALRAERKRQASVMCEDCFAVYSNHGSCPKCGSWNSHTVGRFEQRQHAAALRASLDLTRKLADLRQGR